MKLPLAGFALAIPLFAACAGADPAQPERAASDTASPAVQIGQYPSAPHEDRYGNLWFATAFEGLVRFDGKEFVTFTTKHGLAADSVREILEDEDGRLWFATTGGLCTFDGESFATLTVYEDVSWAPGFGSHGHHRDVWDVLRDRQGQLWIATADGVFRFEGECFRRFPLPVPSPAHSYDFTAKMVYDIFEDRDGALWFGTDGAGVVRYDGTNLVVYAMKAHGLCSDRVCRIVQDARGDLWFGSADGGASRYDGRSFETFLRNETFSESMGWGRVMGLHAASSGDVWFGMSGPVRGAYRYDGEDFRFYSTKDGLGDGHCPSVGEDRSGDLWLGTTAGVYRLVGERFVNFTKDG